jgi:hypothetical protein
MGKQHESFVACGICKKPAAQGGRTVVWDVEKGWVTSTKRSEEDDIIGSSEIVLYNPAASACQTEMTVYFMDRPPYTFAPLTIEPERNFQLTLPDWAPEVFEDCGFWGARFRSSGPLIVNLVDGFSYDHEDDTFKGGCTNILGAALATQWHFADGLWLEWTRFHKGDTSKAPFPFNEIEYYYFLNPGPRDARVDMTLQYRYLEHTTFHLRVPAERLFVWRNFEKIPYNQPYGVKVVSSEPIATSSTRFIYGLHGFDQWGLHTHCGMPPEPGPITE